MVEQDPLASPTGWDIDVKVEEPDLTGYTYLDENGQGNTEMDTGASRHNIDNYEAQSFNINSYTKDIKYGNKTQNDKLEDSDYEPTSKKKCKTKKKNKKPSKPWVSNKLYPCTQCDYVANRYNNLTAHMGKHSDIKNLFCDFCPYSTRYKTSLRRHVKYQHVLNDVVEDCPWCDFKTSFKCNLKTHIQRCHSCTECQFKGSEDEIMSHFNETHAGEEKAMERYLQKKIRKISKQMSRVECDSSHMKTELNSDGSDTGNDTKDDIDNDSDNDIDNIFAPECEIKEISHVSNCEGGETRNEINGSDDGDVSEKLSTKTTIKTIKKKTPIEENKYSCSECEFTTRKCDNFVKHMQSSHDSTFEIDNIYKCRHCEYSSRFKHNVRLHETKHTGEKIYKCTLCDYGTSYNTVFQRHQRKHAQMLLGPFLCSKCSFKTNTQGRLQYHLQRCHQIVNDTAHKCDHCDFYTDVKWRLNKHVKKSQCDGEIICEYCEFKSQFKCQMRMHRKEHLWSLSSSSEKLKSLRKSSKLSGFYAEGQEVNYTNSEQVNDGELVDSVPVNSQVWTNSDGPVANNDGLLVDNGAHEDNDSGRLVEIGGQAANVEQLVSNCGQVANEGHMVLTLEQTSEDCRHLTENFGQPTDYGQTTEQNHFSEESNSQSNYSEPHFTDSTDFQSTSVSTTVNATHYDMTNHLQSDITRQNDMSTSGNLFSYYCIEEQNKLLKNSYTIDEGAIKLNEVRVGFDRTQDKPYSCFQCVYKAKYKAAVQRHYLRHHSTHMRPYKCKYCGFQTTTRDAMWKHIKRSQLLEVVNCECNEFTTRYRCELLQHKKSHYNFRCDLCGLSYKSRYDMERHIMNHKSESIFKCHKCNFSADKEHLLLEHETFHSGTKPFKCDVCSYSTVKQLLLNLHRKKWHGHLCKIKKVESIKTDVGVAST